MENNEMENNEIEVPLSLFSLINSTNITDENGNFDGEEFGKTLGDTMSKMFKSLNNAFKNAKETQMDTDEHNDQNAINIAKSVLCVTGIVSELEFDDIQKSIAVKDFFAECLDTDDIEDAIIITKEKFDLPDGYTITIPLKITIADVNIIKAVSM